MTRAANVDFFAVEADQKAVLDFLYSSTDVQVFESYSEFGHELRDFKSTAELSAAFPLGHDPNGNGTAALLMLWSPSVMRELTIKRIDLNPKACGGHTFRYRIDGGGLMQLYLGGIKDRVVTKSHFGHQSTVRAQKWEVDQGVDWGALAKLSSRIQYHFRKRLAVGKVDGRLILAHAMELARDGYALKDAVGCAWEYKLDS